MVLPATGAASLFFYFLISKLIFLLEWKLKILAWNSKFGGICSSKSAVIFLDVIHFLHELIYSYHSQISDYGSDQPF